MNLNISAIKQQYKTGCGATALSMVFKYFCQDITEKDVVKQIGGLHSYGSLATDLALLADKAGFKVVCHSYDLQYFEPRYAKLSRTKFIKEAESIIQREKNVHRNKTTKSVLAVLKSDIDFKMIMPSLKAVKELLNKKMPVILAVNASILYEEKEKNLRAGHFILLTGYDKDKFYYNDPHDGRKYSVSEDKLFFALSNNVLDSSGYLIAVGK